MKYLYQFGIIISVTFVGELLHHFIPLPVPASIYGLVIMLLCLCTKILRLEHVKDAGDFLLQMMPLMFIPAAVELMVIWAGLQDVLLPVIAITFVTTVVVMVITGKTAQWVLVNQSASNHKGADKK